MNTFQNITPIKFDIRLRSFNFSAAPELDGETAWYEAGTGRIGETRAKSPERFRRAIDAAREAARMNYEAGRDGIATVATGHTGPRPSGTPRHLVPVSYRPRFAAEANP